MSYFSNYQQSAGPTQKSTLENSLKAGQRVILSGDKKTLRYLIHKLAADSVNQDKRVLIIDTINSLNPHNVAFQNQNQRKYFKEIFCVRTPMPCDLWARLATCGKFIEKNKIKTLIITSLSQIFRDYNIKEVEPMLKNILRRIDAITKKYKITTIIANQDSVDDSAMLASNILSKEKLVMEVSI